MAKLDVHKERKVLKGPFVLFEDAVTLELLEPDSDLDASVLMRLTYKADHPLNQTGKKHPAIPPLHIHWDQIESFHVAQGRYGVTMGYDVKDHILTPESDEFIVKPYVPHTIWPVPNDDTNRGVDSIVLVFASPKEVPSPVDDVFFEHAFRYLDECYREKRMANPLQMIALLRATGTSAVVLPKAGFLGPLRWWVPYALEGVLARLARLFGYQHFIPKFVEQDKTP